MGILEGNREEQKRMGYGKSRGVLVRLIESAATTITRCHGGQEEVQR